MACNVLMCRHNCNCKTPFTRYNRLYRVYKHSIGCMNSTCLIHALQHIIQQVGLIMQLNGLFCSLAVLDPRVGHTMDVLSPFISILCHSDWLFHTESCPQLDVVYPGRAWSSSPACTWHCSLHYFFLQAIFFFPQHSISFLALTVSNSFLFTPALLRTHSFVFFAVHETRRIFSPLISKA